MNRLLATLAIAAAAAISPAAFASVQPITFNILCINRVDGITEHLMLSSDMTITMTGEGSIRLAHPQITVEYPSDAVSHFTFDDVENPALYDGDYESALDAPSVADRKIIINGGEITVSGSDGIVLYDLRGVEIARIEAADGSATLAAGAIPSGVYVLRTGSTAIKIKL